MMESQSVVEMEKSRRKETDAYWKGDGEKLFWRHCDFVACVVQETTLYGATVKVHEPVGVIGIACPDEYPLLAFVSLLAPAVIRANCIIIIPSEKFPLVALDLYQVTSRLLCRAHTSFKDAMFS